MIISFVVPSNQLKWFKGRQNWVFTNPPFIRYSAILHHSCSNYAGQVAFFPSERYDGSQHSLYRFSSQVLFLRKYWEEIKTMLYSSFQTSWAGLRGGWPALGRLSHQAGGLMDLSDTSISWAADVRFQTKWAIWDLTKRFESHVIAGNCQWKEFSKK